MTQAVIELKGVSKAFGGVVANHNVSLTVPRGRITGLIGPNGSGKSTLFSSIVGYHPIDAGSILFNGREISRLSVPEIARLGLLRTFQTTRIYGKMNGLENMLISETQRQGGHRQGRASHQLRRPLSETVLARRQPLVRPTEAFGVCHGHDERTRGLAA